MYIIFTNGLTFFLLVIYKLFKALNFINQSSMVQLGSLVMLRRGDTRLTLCRVIACVRFALSAIIKIKKLNLHLIRPLFCPTFK
ncbi:hypothetical protein CC80DRAFT_169417 [Byssothecium circinans]|uniref:Uncharacterized protein n=1 Tax=Byssothecium circinans TaxID=147558 RepID=A0A6A5TM07_9PLEO|nr:hypothetical protein CC80DRAFT_169417 [Byssothecium circinans]